MHSVPYSLFAATSCGGDANDAGAVPLKALAPPSAFSRILARAGADETYSRHKYLRQNTVAL